MRSVFHSSSINPFPADLGPWKTSGKLPSHGGENGEKRNHQVFSSVLKQMRVLRVEGARLWRGWKQIAVGLQETRGSVSRPPSLQPPLSLARLQHKSQ